MSEVTGTKNFLFISMANLNVLLSQDILIQIGAVNCYKITITYREMIFAVISSNFKNNLVLARYFYKK
jgi:hypothetical protein